ncbi:MAG: tetratricopeptide repeat protein [Pseudomonadota bacterium]
MLGFIATKLKPLFFVSLLTGSLCACSNTETKDPAPAPAAAQSEKNTEKDIDSAETLALAERAYAAKDWQTAEKNYVLITRAIPKEAHPWFRLGNIYARTERPEYAVRAYKEALLRDPSLSKAWYNMGLVQLRQSANSFLQMRSYATDNSDAESKASTMYDAVLDVITNGPGRARTFAQPAEETSEPAWIAIPGDAEESTDTAAAESVAETGAASTPQSDPEQEGQDEAP